MKVLLFSLLLINSTVAMANTQIEPYNPTSNTYMVEGKEVNAADATIAALAGKRVMQCKTQKADAIYMVNGKAIEGTNMSKCTVKVLAEGKNGLTFKNKK